MKPSRAFALWILIALYALFAGALVVGVQSALGQELSITPDTACGAPGVGVPKSGTKPVARPDGVPGQRVDSAGTWVPCEMPPPFECRTRRLLVQRVHGVTLVPKPAVLPVGELQDRRTVAMIGPLGPTDRRGTQIWICTPDGWKELPK